MHVARERRESEAFADLRVSERKIYKRERALVVLQVC